MGHGCGSCGGRGCGGCGWGGFGFGGYPYPAIAPVVPVAVQVQPPVMQQPMVVQQPQQPYAGQPMVAQPYGGNMTMASPPGPSEGSVVTSGPAGLVYGAAAPGMGFVQAQMAQYAALRAASGFPVVAVVAPLGFRSKKIRKHKTRTVVAHPDSFYSGKGLFIPRSVAKHFDICEIRVGGVCIFTGRNGYPAEIFSPSGCNVPAYIALPPIMPGQTIRLTVKNNSHKSRWFRAAVQGITML